jgi:hypothetical protein
MVTVTVTTTVMLDAVADVQIYSLLFLWGVVFCHLLSLSLVIVCCVLFVVVIVVLWCHLMNQLQNCLLL